MRFVARFDMFERQLNAFDSQYATLSVFYGAIWE